MAMTRGQMGISPGNITGDIRRLLPQNPFAVMATPAPSPTLGSPQMAAGSLNIRAPQYPPPAYADGGLVAPQAPAPQVGMAPPGMAPQGPAGVSPQGVQQDQILSIQQLQTEVQKFAQANPQVVQAIQAMLMEGINSGEVTQQQISMMVQMAVAAAQNPELYPRLRQLAIQQNLADDEDLPMQYNQGVVFALILAGAALQQSGSEPGAMAQPGMPAPQGQPVQMRDGGYVPMTASPTGDNTGRRDDIMARLSGGEYVIPKHIVEQKGTDFFDKMLGKEKA